MGKDGVTAAFVDLFPTFSRNMLEQLVLDEFKAKDVVSIDFQDFLGLHKRFLTQCRSVVTSEGNDGVRPASRALEDRIGSSSASKGVEGLLGERGGGLGSDKAKGHTRVTSVGRDGAGKGRTANAPPQKVLDLGVEEDEDEEEGDSFFDDPLPKPQKTYGWTSESAKPTGRSFPPPSSHTASLKSDSSHRDHLSSKSDKGPKDAKVTNEKPGGHSMDEDVDYDDDFNSHRSDNSKSEVSIGEEIEEVSIEGPDISDKLDDVTQDVSVSQISQEADYMEEVA